MSNELQPAGAFEGLQALGARIALAVVVVAIILAGSLGIASARSGKSAPAKPGDAVAIAGGVFAVEQIRFEVTHQMAGMKMTSAPGTSLPDPPLGYRRVSVDVALSARTGRVLRFRPELFRLHVPGGASFDPAGIDTGPARVPLGMTASRSVAFNVPNTVRHLELTVDGADRAVTLDPVPAAAHEHADASLAAAPKGALHVGPGPVARRVNHGAYRLEIGVRPNRVGVANRFAVRITRGARPVPGARVTARIEMLEMPMGSQQYRLSEGQRGSYLLSTRALLMAGNWAIGIKVQVPGERPFSVPVTNRVAG